MQVSPKVIAFEGEIWTVLDSTNFLKKTNQS